MLGVILVAIPKYTKGKLALVPKNKDGPAPQVEGRGARRPAQQHARPAAAARARWTRAVSPPVPGQTRVREIKEWQAIMDHLRSLPPANPGELPTIPVDERATEVRAIKKG